MEREVHCTDAITWLEQHTITEGSSLITSLPDFSEFPSLTLAQWKMWFTETAALVMKKTPPLGVSVFYQTDIRHEGEWIDKAFLCQTAAQELGRRLLWHKIALRAPMGTTTFGRPGYTHVLCFSAELKLNLERSTPDVLSELGEKTWARGMGEKVCLSLARFIKEQTPTHTLIQPFCGEGMMLAAANSFGLKCIGIERSPKRAQKARELKHGQAQQSGL